MPAPSSIPATQESSGARPACTRRSSLFIPIAAASALLGLSALVALPQVRAANGAFETVSFTPTGFGVPGAGRPVPVGNHVLLNSGEGDLTLADLTDRRNPKIARYLTSWWFTTHTYPLMARDTIFLSNSKGPLLYVKGVRSLAARGEVEEAKWDRAAWGPAFLAGLRPEGIGYSIAGDEIVALDLSNPQSIKELARVRQQGLKGRQRPNEPEGVIFTPDYKLSAVLLDGGKTVRLLRWNSATSASTVGEFANVAFNDPRGTNYGRIFAVGNSRIVIGHPNSSGQYPRYPTISFWDISNPRQPRRVADHTFEHPATNVRDVALTPDGAHAYVIDGRDIPSGHTVNRWQRSRLYALDLASPSQPRVVGMFEENRPTEYNLVTLAGSTLYVNDYNFGLWTFDVSDPARPVKQSEQGVPASAEGHWLYLKGNHAYVAHTFGGAIHVIDVANPQSPKTVGHYWDGQWLNYKGKIKGKGSAMYVPQYDGLAVVDITSPARPKRAGEFLDQGGEYLQQPTLEIVGNHAYVASAPRKASSKAKAAPSQLLIYSVTNPLAPQLVSTTDLPNGQGFRVVANGTTLYLVGYTAPRLLTVNAADPSRPRITAEFAEPQASFGGKTLPTKLTDLSGNGAPGVGYNRGHLYVTTGGFAPDDPYVLIYDVRSPTAIRPAGTIFVTDRKKSPMHVACDLTIEDDTLYFTDYSSLMAFDLRDPARPVRTAQTYLKYAWQVGTVQGDYLYMPKLSGLEIYQLPGQ